ncbi:hypothetical protein L227DRAFT_572523 [Lentinus tigrinus ALCF2SS1-6]|uniref:Nudix hydrolase domain-containing protein n=1 Tax=Lentinus tigrinus ALCF2SS1-6 TaxID=1328759 RepID=A0A5C2SPH0_9APHY|nr:hypothetical protein L227DRAFT_572523 [Lentinus tigrinus ALCF2SS1-6]
MANPSRWSLTRLLSGDAQQRARENSTSSAQSRNNPGTQSAQQRHAQMPQTPQDVERHRSPQTQTSTQQTSPPNHRTSHTHSSSHPNGSMTSSASNTRGRAYVHRLRRDGPTGFSKFSTPAIPDSLFFAEDFMLGSGMVIIQPSTGKIVLLHEELERDARGHVQHRWFLPKGRKDVGETLEQAALREAYEESGYRVDFLPVIMPYNAPTPPTSLDGLRLRPVTEPIFVNTLEYRNHEGGRNRHGGEYLTFWYIGQVPENPVADTDTRMPDEVNYETYFLDPEQALKCLSNHGTYYHIVKTAYELWVHTVQTQADPEYIRYIAELDRKLLATGPLEGVAVSDEAADENGVGENTSSSAASATPVS